jgi:hypothetical protein
MDERLMQQILPIIEKTKEGIIKAIDIAEKECPIVIKEIVQYNLMYHLVWFLLAILMLIASCFTIAALLKVMNKEFKEDETRGTHWWQAGPTFKTIVLALATVGLIIAGIYNFVTHLEWIKCLVAPRLFLIEYVMQFIKK